MGLYSVSDWLILIDAVVVAVTWVTLLVGVFGMIWSDGGSPWWQIAVTGGIGLVASFWALIILAVAQP